MADIGVSYLQVVPSMQGAVKSIQSSLSGIDLSGVSKKMGNSLSAVLPSSLSKSVSKAMDNAATAAKKPLEEALKGVTSAEDGLAKAQNARQKIVDQIARSEQKLSDLQATGKEGTKAYAQAQSRLAAQQNKLAQASFDVAGAQISLESAQANVAKISGEVEAAIAKQQTSWGKLAISAPAVSDAFKSAGSAIQNVGENLQTVGGKLTKAVTVPAMGAATAVGGLVTALGFKRLMGIENATQALKGLGYSATEAAAIMDGPVLSAVKGTAFGIADAGSAASGFLAGGMKDLDELSRYLKLTGDMAAVGTAEYGHMAQMLQRVAAEGRVTGGDLTQMSQNGVYATAALADSLGVSQEEVRKLASEGKISADQLVDALEKQIGGSALAMGETLEGALANTKAAIGRLGEKIWGDVYPKIKDKLDEFMTMLDSPAWGDAASSLGDFLADAFDKISSAISGVIKWWNDLSPAAKKTIGIFTGVAVAAGPVLMILGKLLSPISLLVTGIGGFIAVAGGMAAAISGTGLAAGASTAALVAYKVTQGAMAVATGVATAAQKLFNLALKDNPIGIVVTVLAALTAALIYFFTQTETGRQVWESFTQFLGQAWQWLCDLGQTIWQGLADFFTGLWESISTAASTAWEAITSVFSAAWEAISTVGRVIWEGISLYITTYITIVKTIITAVLTAVQAVWNTVWNGIKAVATTVWNGIKAAVQTAINIVQSIITAVMQVIKGDWSGAWNTMKDLIGRVWDGIKTGVTDGIDKVMGFIRDLPGKIKGVFSDAGSWLVESGQKIIGGLVEGIQGMISKVTDAVGNVMGAARNLLPFSPAKEGPFSGKGWTLYSGRSIVEALAEGVSQKQSVFKNAVAGVMRQGEFALENSAALNASFAQPTAAPLGDAYARVGAGSLGSAVTQNFDVHTDNPELVAAVVAEKLRRAR